MKDFLKKKLVFRTTVGQELLKSLFSALFATFIVYFCIANGEIRSAISFVTSGNIKASEFALILMPCFIIIELTLKSAMIVSLNNKK